ncbi:MAG: sodium:proton antiporter [Prevotellaceae bacterium]|jgi:NhaC family Na+:H+ antiporter|nr:sodium:proton antiporter [Prevotellaceae bacterium]
MKRPSLLLSVVPVVFLIGLIAVAVPLFGDDITAGPAQIALLSATSLAALISILYLKVPWNKLETFMLDHLSKTGAAVFILLMIGALTGSWMMSGIVPTMISYGLKLINPGIFLFTIFILASIASLVTGSSWTTVGTIGLAMFAAGKILGIPAPWLAGAIISGAYFGDKMSPLSDTTNLAATVGGTDLYTHVKYMAITVTPAYIIAGIVYVVAGFFLTNGGNINIDQQCIDLQNTFHISPFLLLVPCATGFMIYKKVSPFLSLFLSALMGILVACLFQPHIIRQISPEHLSNTSSYIFASFQILSSKCQIITGNEMLDTLCKTSGMAGMLNTVWLILCVTTFGGVMEASGMISRITQAMLVRIKSTFSLVGSTIASCIFCNVALSDQYMSILLPGKMFAKAYKEKGYAPELLSRTLEDSGTVTSVLVPWNTCAVVQSGVLGISTLAYLPYCFFNILSPIVSLVVAAIGYKIRRITTVST